MRALCERMKMPPWLKIRSTGAEVADTVNCADKSLQIFKLFVRNYVLQGGIW